MFKKTFVHLLFISLMAVLSGRTAAACESCGCALARSGGPANVSEERPWFFDFTTEQQNWDEIPATEAHALHHQGHDVHVKTHEEFYHFALGRRLGEDWTVYAELPYVARHSVEIDDHARLGKHEVSEGLGDLRLTATWRFARNSAGYVGAMGGVKLPTGSTTEKNSRGVRFEPELQPSSGSTDGMAGAVYGVILGSLTAEGNAFYTFRTVGDQDFRYGDSFASYTAFHVPVGPSHGEWTVEAGADLNLQIEARHEVEGVKGANSGGTTLLAGPAVTIRSKGGFAVTGNFLLPAVQNLGGLHQEMDFAWNLGGKLAW